MWLADNWKDYEVLDTSAGEKLERWGKYILVRPDPQVIWNTPKDDPLWQKYDARYARSSTGGSMTRATRAQIPEAESGRICACPLSGRCAIRS